MTLQSLYNHDFAGNLSPDESAALAAHIASLAKSGLPLESGLRALADEVPSRRLARILQRLARRLASGEPFETAIQVPGSRLPAHLRGLIVAGIQSGRLPEILDEYVKVIRSQESQRRRLVISCIYPALLLAICAVLLVFCDFDLVPQFSGIFHDFGSKLPELTVAYFVVTHWIVVAAPYVAAALLFLGAASIFGPVRGWLAESIRWIPLIGPIKNANRVAQFSRWMVLLLERQIPLPQALRLAADGMGDSGYASACHRTAEKVENGRSLGEALRDDSRFPPCMTVLVDWGEYNGMLSEAFRISAESFDARAQAQVALMDMVLPAFIFLAIITFMSVTVLALLMPLAALISNLSGDWAPSWSSNPSGPAGVILATFEVIAIPILFFAGPLCLLAVRLISGPPPRKLNIGLILMRIVGWFLTVLAILAITASGAFLIGIWPIAIMIVVAMALNQNAKSLQYSLLGLLAAAAERSLPLIPIIETFAIERGGWFRRRGLRLAKLLDEGHPLPSALELERGVLPLESMPLVLVGFECGGLPEALRHAAAARIQSESTLQAIVPKLVYILIFPGFMIGVLSFMVLKIMPQLEKIFKDFGTSLPPITRMIFETSRPDGLLVLFLGLACVTTTVVAIYTLLRYAGVIRWDLPGTSWIVRRLDRAAIFDALSYATGHRQPMNRALFALARSYPKRTIRRRLLRTIDEVNAGAECCKSLHREGLLSSIDLALIEAASRTGNLPWALREAADSNRRRFTYRVHALIQVTFPVIVVGFGLVVLVVAVATFLPLTELITRLAPP